MSQVLFLLWQVVRSFTVFNSFDLVSAISLLFLFPACLLQARTRTATWIATWGYWPTPDPPLTCWDPVFICGRTSMGTGHPWLIPRWRAWWGNGLVAWNDFVSVTQTLIQSNEFIFPLIDSSGMEIPQRPYQWGICYGLWKAKAIENANISFNSGVKY